jgi:sugar (pentulose or hexulose) kinase
MAAAARTAGWLMARLLAIDVGTQSVRALVFDAQGRVLAKVQRPFEPAYRSPQPGWAEQDAEVYWEGVVAVCQALWEDGAVRPEQVDGMALTTLRGSVVCLDAAGRPLRPAILWLDQREAGHVPDLGPAWGLGLRLAGAADLLAHFQRQAEANWLAEHEPQRWAQTQRFLLLSGYLHWRLVGDYVDSAAAQVGYLPFDHRRLDYPRAGDFRWRLTPIRREQLPRLAAPGERLPDLSAPAAHALGLRAGLPVVAAASDKACEVLGCGALAPDVAHLSFGTTATINTTQARYVEVQRWLPAYPASVPGRYNTEIQIFRGFWLVNWFKREFAQREQALAAQRAVPVESLFEALVESVPPGSQGLTLQPYWSPGVRDPGPEAKGAIIGFGDVHTRAHLYRAILEGLAYSLRAGRERIERRLGHPLRCVIASGGGAQSDAVMQIVADVFGQTVSRPEHHEAAALGAAINLAVGLRIYPDHAAAAAAMTRAGRSFEPRPQVHRLYDAMYREVYSRLYARLRPLYRRIRRIVNYPA